MKYAIFLIVSCLCISQIRAENKWKIIETMSQFDEVVKSADDGLVLMEFFAKWCGPCKAIAPALEKLAIKYDNVVMIKADVDENIELAGKFKVASMPTFVYLKNAKTLESFGGANLRRVEDTINRFNDNFA